MLLPGQGLSGRNLAGQGQGRTCRPTGMRLVIQRRPDPAEPSAQLCGPCGGGAPAPRMPRVTVAKATSARPRKGTLCPVRAPHHLPPWLEGEGETTKAGPRPRRCRLPAWDLLAQWDPGPGAVGGFRGKQNRGPAARMAPAPLWRLCSCVLHGDRRHPHSGGRSLSPLDTEEKEKVVGGRGRKERRSPQILRPCNPGPMSPPWLWRRTPTAEHQLQPDHSFPEPEARDSAWSTPVCFLQSLPKCKR